MTGTHDPMRSSSEAMTLAASGTILLLVLASGWIFCAWLMSSAGVAGESAISQPAEETPTGPFALPNLPYDKAALAPYISAETIGIHWGRHHRAYIDNLNKLVAGKSEAKLKIEEIIMTSEGALFNNAAQAWNHAFYWNCMKPGGGGEPTGPLADAIRRDFGSFATFRDAFAKEASAVFGSGWVWLVCENGHLKITQTCNADLPMKHGQTALLGIDVWEHAYYVDYRNVRGKYIDDFLDKLVNWDFVSTTFANSGFRKILASYE